MDRKGGFKIAHSSKPGIVPNECRGRGRDRAPPKASNAVPLDPMTEERCPAGPLSLECRLECVYRGEDHAKTGSASRKTIVLAQISRYVVGKGVVEWVGLTKERRRQS